MSHYLTVPTIAPVIKITNSSPVFKLNTSSLSTGTVSSVVNNCDNRNTGAATTKQTSIVVEPQELTIDSKLKLIIEKFSEIGNDHILSPVFNIGSQTKWYIKVKTNSCFDATRRTEYLSIHLFLSYCQEATVGAQYTVSIVDANHKLHNTRSCDQIAYKISGQGWGYQKYCEKQLLLDRSEDLLSGNRLTLLFHIQVTAQHNHCIEDNFLTDFQKIRGFKWLSDVRFIVEGKEFFAHKCILAMKSPVFAAMFVANHRNGTGSLHSITINANITNDISNNNDMNGNKTMNSLVISDADSNVFRELLAFIYTGRLSTQLNGTVAQKLLPVAHTYGVTQLKSICEDVLYEGLTTGSAVKTMILAEKCLANKLRHRVIDYIADNLLPVRSASDPNEWKRFIEEYPSVVDSIFDVISDKTTRSQSLIHKNQFVVNRWICRKF